MDSPEQEEYIIEEIVSTDVPETELNEFHVVHPLQLVDMLDKSEMPQMATNTNDLLMEESEIITQFMNEQGELPDMYTKLKPDEDDLEDFETFQQESTTYKPSYANVNDAGASTSANATATLKMEQKFISTSLGDETDDDNDYGKSKRTRTTERSARRRTILNAALQGLMGEANLSFARGQIEIAEKICLEIIRQNPLAPEPFLTLASIYETRDTEKFLNFLTIAAHLKPNDRDQWIRIAEMHIAQGNLSRARVYYTKAIRAISKDYDLRLRKARLLENMGEENYAMFTYLKMLPHVPAHEHELCISIAKQVARHFHAQQKYKLALEAMDAAYNTCAPHFSTEDLNLYLEILMVNKQFEKGITILRKNTGLIVDTEYDPSTESIRCCLIPNDYIAELRTKTCVCLINMRAFNLLNYLIQNIHEHIPLEQDRLDLYIDVAEALMQEKKFIETLALLEPITSQVEFECPAFVWLKQAECLRLLQRYEEAIDSLQRVVKLAPFCYEAKFTLSALLKQQGRHLEAIKALEQCGEKDGEPIHARLLYERCIMLQQVGYIDEYLEVGYALLSRHSIKLRNREELYVLAYNGNFYNADGIKSILQMRNIAVGTEKVLQEYNKVANEQSDLSVEDEYKLFRNMLNIAFDLKKYSIIQRICFGMITTKRFIQYRQELERIVILACYFNDDCTIAFSYLRELIAKQPHRIVYWNLLSLFVQKGQHLRYHRFVRRLMARELNLRKMDLFLAHYHLHCSSFKYALNIYVPLYKQFKMPIVALCIAVVFNQLSMQKKVLRKSAALAQAISFAQKYSELRVAECGTDFENAATKQEICYNFGRIYHQAGLTHLAIEYYERALHATHPLIEAHAEQLSLKQEIAFNLHLIYRANGNLRKARQYLYEYIVV